MGEPRPRGRRPAGSDTRGAIVEVARRRFAELGYGATSLRAVAQEAGVDPRLVAHYFGSKQALFVAVIDLPYDPETVFEQLLGDGTAGPGSVGERLAEFALSLLQDPDALAGITGIVRAAASEEAAGRILRDEVTARFLLPLARRVTRDRAEVRAGLIGSQIVGLVMARHVVGLAPLAEASPALLVRALAPVIDHYLTVDLDEHPLPVPAGVTRAAPLGADQGR